MNTIDSNIRQRYLSFYSDCVPVRGAKKSAIYDLTRQEIIRIPGSYFDLIEAAQQQTIGELIDGVEHQAGRESVVAFIEFLLEHEMINTSIEPVLLPAINADWEIPCDIQNAIIDVDQHWHDFASIIQQLDELGCEVIQLRVFSTHFGLSDVSEITRLAANTSIQGIELVMAYEQRLTGEDYLSWLEEEPLIAKMTVHSAPQDQVLTSCFGVDEAQATLTKSMEMVSQVIDSASHCGMITPKHLNQPTTQLFLELKHHNGCLNKKVSVDAGGEIRNCPSMRQSYGHHSQHAITDAVKQPSFRALWGVHKDQIEVCRDCELRYACTDCRAYVTDAENLYSKPSKCAYDPFRGEWQADQAVQQTSWKVKSATG